MRYKSDYFAVWNDGARYYKLGIGTGSNGEIMVRHIKCP